ncbi:MAG: hypothetical protein ACTSQW_08485 [Promethearchaeota archaeon]
MAKVNLNLLNIFQLKLKEKSVKYEGKTVGDVISQFVKEYSNKLEDGLLSKNGKKLNKQMLILVNGQNINYLKGYKTKLNV